MSLASALIAGAIGYSSGNPILKNLSNENRAEILDMVKKEKSGIPSTDVPVKVISNFPNAVYVKPNTNTDSVKGDTTLAKNIRKMMGESGGIIVGKEFVKPTIIQHELGHSKDNSFLSNISPVVERIWRQYKLPVVGTAAAITLGELFKPYRDMFTLGNLGIQAASTVPLLVSEYNASEYANKQPGVNKTILDKTFQNYLINALGKRIGLPALAHAGQYVVGDLL